MKFDPDWKKIALFLAVLVAATILASWLVLALASWSPTQTWGWDETPTATSYRIYWQAAMPDKWCPTQYLEVQASQACKPVNGKVECQGDPGAIDDAGLVFFNVTALNAVGESAWDHGAIAGPCGTGYRYPWKDCVCP